MAACRNGRTDEACALSFQCLMQGLLSLEKRWYMLTSCKNWKIQTIQTKKNPNKKIRNNQVSLNPKKHWRSWRDGLSDVPSYFECVLGADSSNFLWVATGWYSFQRPEVILIFVIFFRRPSNVCLDLEYVVSLYANSLAESKNAVVVVTSHKQLSFPSVQLCVPLYQSPQNPQVHSRF